MQWNQNISACIPPMHPAEMFPDLAKCYEHERLDFFEYDSKSEQAEKEYMRLIEQLRG